VNSNAAYEAVSGNEVMIPRFREAGDLTLDLFHRDARVADNWLGLHPREFELIWRLAEEPGQPISRMRLLADVWRINFDPETNSVAVHVARVRAKLAPYGLTDMLVTHPSGGYLLDVPADAKAYLLKNAPRA
jgi:two-component system, OmpR family, response regulator